MTPLTCATHKTTPAEFECVPCGVVCCRACIRMLKDGRTPTCVRCGGLLLPFVAAVGPVSRAPQRAGVERPLLERLPSTIAYLGKPSVLLTMLGLAIIIWLGSFSFILGLIAAGVQAAVFFRIVERTAYGEDNLDPPDFTELWSDVVLPFMRYLATLVPLIIAWIGAGLGLAFGMAPRDMFEALGPWLALAILWLLLWPLLIMVAAITRSIVAVFDPRVWWKVLMDMRADYVIGAVAFYLTMLVDVFVFVPLAIKAVIHAPIPVVMPILINFAAMLLMAWRGRILGETCRPYVDA